jgi:tetratricopeptide (TPR) repeat protein
MKIQRLSLPMLLLAASTAFAQTTAEDYYKLAAERVRVSDNRAALINLDKAIGVDPTYSAAYLLRGKLQSDHLAGIADLTKAIELGTDNLSAYDERARRQLCCYSSLDAAIADYEKLIELGGDRRRAYFFAATAYDAKASMSETNGNLALGKTYRSKAIELYTKSIAESAYGDAASALAYSFRGVAHFVDKEYERALADANMAIKLDPGSVYFLHRRIAIYEATGQKELAAADEQRVYELTRKRPK